MRRRRQKNPLLGRMIGLAVLINAVLLPVLASLGVFHTRRQSLIMTQLITLPKQLPQPTSAKPKVVRRSMHSHPRTARKQGSLIGNKAVKANPNAPRVEASASAGPGNGTEIDNSGNGRTGVVPTVPSAAAQTPPSAAQPVSMPATNSAAQTSVPVQPPIQPVYTSAVAVDEPSPVVPDDLALDQAPPPLRALFTVHADGTATVSKVESSGNTELDQIVLDTVKRWTFRPATKDGVPVESYLRLEVEFNLS